MAGTAAGDLQSSLADAARATVESGAETGLQVAVLHRGRLVADVAAAAEPWWEAGTRFGYHAQISPPR